MSLPNPAQAALLQALLEGEGYGLELIDRVKERSRGEVELGQGTVYPALRAMERDGLVESWEGEPLPERGGRPRRYYKITPHGVKAANAQRVTFSRLFNLATSRLLGSRPLGVL